MKILIFSDIHSSRGALARILAQPADVYIADGDLVSFQKGLGEAGESLASLGERLWLLPGNHETHDDTRTLCDRHGFFDFHRKVRALPSAAGPTYWAGLGYSNITPFGTPGEYTEEELAQALSAFESYQPLYLVAHVPPHGSKLDEFAPGRHAGSTALREWIDRVQPLYVFCGHIHETAGVSDALGATRCINVGPRGFRLEL